MALILYYIIIIVPSAFANSILGYAYGNGYFGNQKVMKIKTYRYGYNFVMNKYGYVYEGFDQNSNAIPNAWYKIGF